MTGSIHQFNRQHSSTTGDSNMKKTQPRKLRRCSSADEHNAMELLLDDNQHKEILVFKREHTTSDIDSGTEEIEQQLEHVLVTTINDNEDQLSIKSFGPNPDEGFSECEREEESSLPLIIQDLERAKIILDDTKKDFCSDTSVVFHGEFARLISIPLSLYYDVRYYLFAEEELDDEFYANLKFECLKLDNAKAQFKCPNFSCQHAWTSMRARISFSISDPINGFIVLKIFGQNCQHCGTNADALWYIDEVCRVMKNLAQTLFEKHFPDMMNHVDLTYHQPTKSNMKQPRHPNHDPTQRKGKMYAPHAKEFCEACRLGLCFG